MLWKYIWLVFSDIILIPLNFYCYRHVKLEILIFIYDLYKKFSF